jgi:hypothetical protein
MMLIITPMRMISKPKNGVKVEKRELPRAMAQPRELE